MGCLVEKTDTGVELEVHRFDDRLRAVKYLMGARDYKFERHEPWAFTQGIDFYQGPDPGQRASLRYKAGTFDSAAHWSVAFWRQ